MDDTDYKKKKIRNMQLYGLAGIGLLLITLVLGYFNITIGKGDFFTDMLSVWSAILIVGSITQYIKIKRMPNLLKIDKITEYDERNVILRGKSAYLSFILSTIGLAIIMIILIYLDYIIPLYLVSALLVIQYISFLVFVIYFDKRM